MAINRAVRRAPDLAAELHAAAVRAQFGPFGAPPLRLAEGGAASGARGAAYAAFQALG